MPCAECTQSQINGHAKVQYATVGVNKSNFDGEIEAISLALQHLLHRLQAFETVAIVVDSKAAIQAVSSKSVTKKINDIGPQTSPGFHENSHILVGSLKCWTRR